MFGWDTLIWWVILTALQYALTPKPESPKPASLQDFTVPTADEDRAISVVFGTVNIPDLNAVWYGDLESQPIEGGGGK